MKVVHTWGKVCLSVCQRTAAFLACFLSYLFEFHRFYVWFSEELQVVITVEKPGFIPAPEGWDCHIPQSQALVSGRQNTGGVGLLLSTCEEPEVLTWLGS